MAIIGFAYIKFVGMLFIWVSQNYNLCPMLSILLPTEAIVQYWNVFDLQLSPNRETLA